MRIDKALEELRSYSRKDWLLIGITLLTHLIINTSIFFYLREEAYFEEKVIGMYLLSSAVLSTLLIIAGSLLKRSFLNLILLIVLLSSLEIYLIIKIYKNYSSQPEKHPYSEEQ
ncbi:MAG: hypothetical protein H6599_08380 [Flavobacteriales bacterium]|nr:hypothetical protein [Flavobacteriales bacterium]